MTPLPAGRLNLESPLARAARRLNAGSIPADTPVRFRGANIPPPTGAPRESGLSEAIDRALMGAASGAALTSREAYADPLLGGLVGGIRSLGAGIERDSRERERSADRAMQAEDRGRRQQREDASAAVERAMRRLEFGFDPADLPSDFGATDPAEISEQARAFQSRLRQDKELERRGQESLIERRQAMNAGPRPPGSAGPKPVQRFKGPEEVREAVRAGRLTRQQGVEVLRRQFGFE